tara:strand:- start:286 stop:618 length:333 start_codon:yes stop_codon:yes gene_type:complete
MNELLNGFLSIAEKDEENLSVEGLLTEEERLEWETLVKALDTIDVLNVGNDLKKISKTYQLSRWQELSILAYVKILELMMMRAKESGAMDMMSDVKTPPTQIDNTGGMFG